VKRVDGRKAACVLQTANWNGAPVDGRLGAERRARAAPEAAERRFHRLLDSVADPVVVADAAGRIVFVNRQAEVAFGYERVELGGQPVELLLRQPGRIRVVRGATSPAPPPGAALALVGRRKDGRRMPVEVSVGAVELDGERLTTCVVRDVTGRCELERQKDEFFTDVSHELSAPIATIKALTDVLLATQLAGASDGLHLLLGNVQREAERMQTLVDDLLELGRLQGGRVRLRAAPCDMRDMVQRAAMAIEPLARQRRQVIDVRVPDGPVVAVVDAARLERALLNLLSNAHKYSWEGGVIRLTIERVGAELVLSVADNGPGIPRAEWERIFQRFYRSPTEAARRVQGSGLGLPIARGVVELHGGRISVDSPPDSGAVFRIHLPIGGRPPTRDEEEIDDDHPAG
jgi:PAS domain S-box-containing protein